MAQHDYVIANASGATVRADINNMALAISSNNSGSSAPSTTYAYLWWLDTSANVLKLRNSANNAWITMPFSITASNTVDINGGTIDGTNIGASSAGTGAFTTLTATTFTSAGIDDNANATAITIDSEEKVGIQTTSPSAILEIKDSGASAPGTALKVHSNQNSAAADGLVFIHSEQSVAPFTALNVRQDGNGDILNLLDGTTEVFTVINGGNTGIGQPSPDSVLHIKDSGDTYVTLEGGASDANVGFNFQNSSGTQKGYILYDTDDNQLFGQINNSEAFRFKLGTGSHECMSIGGITPRSDITLTQQGHGENWASGAHTSNGYFYVISSSNNGVYVISGQNSWTSNSDERIKENITSLGTILPEIANIRCVKFNLKGDSQTRVGFIAQDWESKSFKEVLNENDGFVVEEDGSVKPSADSDSTNKVKGIAYTETIPVLLKAIQEQQTIIEDLKTRIETLEG